MFHSLGFANEAAVYRVLVDKVTSIVNFHDEAVKVKLLNNLRGG